MIAMMSVLIMRERYQDRRLTVDEIESLEALLSTGSGMTGIRAELTSW
jgi:hypothetical protein